MVYGLSIWSQTNQCIINQVECLYNRALKVLDRKQITYHHCQILSKYKILSFAHFVFFHYVKLVFKCLNGLAPMPLCKFIVRLQGSSRSTRAASSGNCRVIHCKTSFAQTALSVKGVNFFNSLPDYLKSIANYNHFKKATESWLLHQQTCSHV